VTSTMQTAANGSYRTAHILGDLLTYYNPHIRQNDELAIAPEEQREHGEPTTAPPADRRLFRHGAGFAHRPDRPAKAFLLPPVNFPGIGSGVRNERDPVLPRPASRRSLPESRPPCVYRLLATKQPALDGRDRYSDQRRPRQYKTLPESGASASLELPIKRTRAFIKRGDNCAGRRFKLIPACGDSVVKGIGSFLNSAIILCFS